MKTLPRQLAFSARISDETPPVPLLEDGGIWSFDRDMLDRIDASGMASAVVLAPTQAMLILVVDLPLPTRSRRIAALPFAVEDDIAEPIDMVHVALGEEVAPGRFLAAIVRHEVMRGWIAQMTGAGLDRAALVPDALTLPRPPAGCWAVRSDGARALVRADDGSGFAIPAAHLATAWQAAGAPKCLGYGVALPADIDWEEVAPGEPLLALRASPPALDLRQGPYAPPRRAVDPLWRRIATVAAIGALAHGAIALADTVALSRIATQREAEVRTLAAARAPGIAIGDDLSGAVADILPDTGAATPGTFLPLLERVARALKSMGGSLKMQSVAFDATAGTLALEVQAPDIATLQKIAGTLTTAGLIAESGSASVDQGQASGTFTVRAP